MWAQASSGPPERSEAVRFELRLDDPSEGVVRIVLTYPGSLLGPAPHLDLLLPDLEHVPDALSVISARSGSIQLRVTGPVGEPPVVLRVHREGASGDIEVRFTVDPTFYPPEVSERRPRTAVARIASDLGVVRTTTILPLTRPAARELRLRFRLPEGWRIVTPWARQGGEYVFPATLLGKVDYLALGPFDTEAVDALGVEVRLATYAGDHTLSEATTGARSCRRS